MKVVQINSVCGSGSTGRICVGISECLREKGYNSFVFYGLGHSDYLYSEKTTSLADYYLHNLASRLLDCEGLCSVSATNRLISRLKAISPDVVHIHNLHGHYINYRILLDYLVHTPSISVVLTMHDCWSFTGHCAHFDNKGCNEWENGCYSCNHLDSYPKSYFFCNSRNNFVTKKSLFESIKNRLTLVPVSYWMSSFLPNSMFNGFSSRVIHNGINLSLFNPTCNSIERRVLGVANPWSEYKGLKDFFKLRELLPSDVSILLIGLNADQIKSLPNGVCGIPPTSSIRELAHYYSSSQVLVNTTYCDNYPTVNLESIACGTPVITYNTGGSSESISNDVGMVVPKGDIVSLANSVMSVISKGKGAFRENCIKHAHTCFDQNICFGHYIDLYGEICKR